MFSQAIISPLRVEEYYFLLTLDILLYVFFERAHFILLCRDFRY